jgi:hypothetical protein
VSPAAFLLAAALLVQEAGPPEPTAVINEGGAFGWRCWAPVTLGRFQGSVLRSFGSRLKHSPYVMQVELPDPDDRRTVRWTVDPRPAGPPQGKKKKRRWARAQADAFRNGPDSVVVQFKWEHVPLTGPLWVQFWGDGAYGGAQILMNARDTRRYFRKGRGPTGAGTSPGADVIAKLASARRWTAVALDSSGKRLASETFEVPGPEEAEAAFREARRRIDSLEPRFAASHDPIEEGGAGCSDEEDPAATI